MNKGIWLVTLIISLLFSLSSAFSGEIKDKFKDENMLELYNRKGDLIGIAKREKGHFVFYDNDALSFREKDKNVWEMYNRKDEFVGTLKKDKSRFSIYDKKEKYMGIILESEKLMPRGHRTGTTQLTPEAAKLYLDILEGIEKIK
jgi:hypothetical protein